MTKKLIITPREQDIIKAATYYSVRVGRANRIVEHEEVARHYAEQDAKQMKRPALLYAVGKVCGIEASAMFASFCPKFGWKEGVPA